MKMGTCQVYISQYRYLPADFSVVFVAGS